MATLSMAVATAKEASYTDAEFRMFVGSGLSASGHLGVYSGVRPGSAGNTGLSVSANGTPNNLVFVGTGVAGIESIPGAYIMINDATKQLTVPAAHASLLRRDVVVLDPEAASEANRILYIAGTPGGGVPAVTAPQYKLAEIDCRSTAVAGGTVIRSVDIFDKRTFLSAPGGVLVCTSATRPTTPHPGLCIYETDTGLLLVANGSGGYRSFGSSRMVTSSTRPAGPLNGEMIFETDTGIARVWRADQAKWQGIGGDAPACRVVRSTDATLANNTRTTCTWSGVTYDDPGGALAMWSSTVNPTRITVPVSGLWAISIQTHWAENYTGGRETILNKNSTGDPFGGTTLVHAAVAPFAGEPRYQTYFEAMLNAGDHLEVFHYQSSGGNLNRIGTQGALAMQVRWLRDV